MKTKWFATLFVAAMLGNVVLVRFVCRHEAQAHAQSPKQAFEGQITFLNGGLTVFTAQLAKPPEMIHVRVYDELYAVLLYEIVDDDRHVTYGRVITGELKEVVPNQWEVDSPEPRTR